MKIKKYIICLTILSLILIVSCTNSNQNSNAGGSQGPPPLPPTGDTKTFNITAKQFEFIPNTITVNQGDIVILNLESTDVTHGFLLTDYGINKQLLPNQTVTVQFIANKKGTFPFMCNVVCGSGHKEMTGQLIVQ